MAALFLAGAGWPGVPFLFRRFSTSFPEPGICQTGLLHSTSWRRSWPLAVPLPYKSIAIYASPLQRNVSKPEDRVLFGLVCCVLLVILQALGEALFPSLNAPDSLYPLVSASLIPSLSFLFIPVGISVAILRSQLWDIDALINRTLVYGTLTVLLALIYVGLVIGLGGLVRLFTGQFAQSPVVIVASTLAIAALFHPLRHRIQAIIDRRFYRRKYDAARTIAAFSAHLRQEVDLATLSEHLMAVVQETMQPAHVSLWLRKTGQEHRSNADRFSSRWTSKKSIINNSLRRRGHDAR